jgi:hypothetical protein
VKTAWRQQRTDRFRILHRDQFACRYCGCRPGCDLLEVDHLVPRSRGGSDDAANLVAACKTCNSRKSDTIFFPHDLIERIDEEDGWFVHKTFGEWSVVFCEDAIGVQKCRYGFIEGRRLFDDQLMRHLYEKPWGATSFSDMERAFDHLRQMLVGPGQQGGQDG